VFTSAETFAVGSDVYTKDEQGTNVPAVAGEYVMEDGTTIVVGEDGMVAEIKEKEMEAEMSSEDFFSAIDKLSERISALESEKAQLSQELSSEKARVAELSKDLNATKTELSAIRRTPAATSVKEKSVTLAKTAPVQEKSFSQMTLRERIMSNIKNIQR
jgi:septal ring factor EnvC (AmiA/AmiB activator)